MKSTKSTRAKFFLIASILCVSVIFDLSGFPNTASAQNNPPDIMEDLMEEIMEEIRDEINQEIKTEVRRETTETVAEETLSPSNTFSGVYKVTGEDDTAICNLTITQTGFSGRCTGSHTVIIITGTGGNFATFFEFEYTITEDDDPGCGPEDGLGRATLISGNGEPGTTIEVTLFLSSSGCVSPQEVIIIVKQ